MIDEKQIQITLELEVGKGKYWSTLKALIKECEEDYKKGERSGYFGVPFRELIPYLKRLSKKR